MARQHLAPAYHSTRAAPARTLFPVIVQKLSSRKSFLLSRGIDSSGMLLSCLAEGKVFTNFHLNAPNAIKLKENRLSLPLYCDTPGEGLGRIINAVEAYRLSEKRE